jgi:hypothetical protein
MTCVTKAWKTSALTAVLLGVAVLGGIGLANYAESGAFSFYKQPQRIGEHDQYTDLPSAPAATPPAVYSSPSAAEYPDWIAPSPAPIADAPIADTVIDEGDYSAWSEDDLDQSPDLQRTTAEPQTEPSEPPLSQARPELSSPPDGSDAGESPTAVLPIDRSGTLPSTVNEPTRDFDELRN